MSYSTFSGFEMGKRMLNAFKLVQETAGHNVANASTKGYSRQSVTLQASPAYTTGGQHSVPTMVGTGVDATAITRTRDVYLDSRRMDASSNYNQANTVAAQMAEVESALGEPSDDGISGALGELASALTKAAANPEDISARTSAVQTAKSLATKMNSAYNNVLKQGMDADSALRGQVEEINADAQSVATLNNQIAKQIALGNSPNDLMDQRQVLLDGLAAATGATVTYSTNGMANVDVGGHWLVAMDQYDQIQSSADPARAGFTVQTFQSDGRTYTPRGGTAAGYAEVRDSQVPDALASMDSLANALRDDLNALQASGYPMGSTSASAATFFTGTGARDLAVDPALLADPSQLAAAKNPGAVGDGTNATAMADLFSTANGTLGGTYTEALASLVSKLGTATSLAKSEASSYKGVSTQLDSMQTSLAGVNTDEETISMVEAQNAYEAGAKYISILDQMLDTLINGIK